MSSTAELKLENLCDLISVQVDPQASPDSLYIGLEHVPPGRFLTVVKGVARDVQSSKFSFQAGDVLYGKLRPYLDKAVIAERAGICTTELLVLRPKAGIEPGYVAGVVHSPAFIEHAMSGITGAHHPRTSWNHISQFTLPQRTKGERRGISMLLWKVQELLRSCEIATDVINRVKQTAMTELFTRGLRGEMQKETEIGWVPESWQVVRLGDLGRVGNGSTPKRSMPAYWTDGAYPWLTSAKMDDRDIIRADQFVTPTALAECHLPKVQPC